MGLFIEQQIETIAIDYLIYNLLEEGVRPDNMELIMKSVFRKSHRSTEDQKNYMWSSMKSEPKLLKAYLQIFKEKDYTSVVKSIFRDIEDKDLLEQELESLFQRKDELQTLIGSIVQIKKEVITRKE